MANPSRILLLYAPMFVVIGIAGAGSLYGQVPENQDQLPDAPAIQLIAQVTTPSMPAASAQSSPRLAECSRPGTSSSAYPNRSRADGN